ncbi:MAG TPA: POTRA domain-containing protein [Sphingomicrobium sp.]|nr:POTRA domain-containing protein [Sphingomicrobium sp.]
MASSVAYAQTDPGSIERTIPKFDVKPADKQPRVPDPALPSQDGGRVAGTFVLGAVNIDGATIFTSEQLAASFEPFLASEVGQAELEQIADDITERYRRAGYLLSYAVVPEQSVQSGIIRIKVVEGYIAKVRLKGDTRAGAAASGIAERLGAERPLRTASLERALGLARDIPGVIVSDTRISRSPGDPSRHELTITLGRHRVRSLVYSDNRGTIEGARLRGYSSFSLPSLVLPGDQLQIDLFTIPSNKFRFFYGQAKASVPIDPSGLRLSVSGSYADQLQRVDGPNQRGKSRLLVAELSYPLLESRAFSLAGHLSLGDWKSENERNGISKQRDRLQVARGWLELSRVSKSRLEGRIGISHGLDLWSATRAGDPLASRPGAGGKFTKFNAEAQAASRLTKRLLLRVTAAGQYSTKPLLTPEEFALGGSRIGRAFDFNDVTGDHGVGAMVEISNRLGDIKRGPQALEIFTFVDGGGAFRKEKSPGLPKEQWLASAGAGARFSALGLTWSGEIGVPVARSHANRDIRAFFSVAKSY